MQLLSQQSTANFSELCAPALCDLALIGSVWLSRSGYILYSFAVVWLY